MPVELNNRFGLQLLRLTRLTASIFPPFYHLMNNMEKAAGAFGLPDTCRTLIERSKIKYTSEVSFSRQNFLLMRV